MKINILKIDRLEGATHKMMKRKRRTVASDEWQENAHSNPHPRCEYVNAVDKGVTGEIGVKAVDKELTGRFTSER